MGNLATSRLPSAGTQCFRAGDKIKSGPQVALLTTSPFLYGGSPTLESGGQNQKWSTSWQIADIATAVWGIPKTLERGEIRSGPQEGVVTTLPLLFGEPQRFATGVKIRLGPQVSRSATSPLRFWGSAMLHSGGHIRKCPTSV